VKWESYQTTPATVAEWDAWLAETPDLNVALVTGGLSGVTVVDVDGPEGMASMRPVADQLPKTLLQQSPHGWHMFFRYQAGIRNKARLMPGVDVRGEGGYVLVAPSRLPDAAYRWARRVELQPFPAWLAASKPDSADPAKPPKGPTPTEQPRWVASALTGGAPSGQRNAVATRLAGYFFGHGHPDDVVRSMMEPYRLACRPPMETGELDGVIRSVARYRRFAASAGVTDPPTVQRTVAGERYLWDDIAVDVRGVSRSKTAILAELGITLSLPGLPETVKAPSVLNLVSQRERDGLAQSLRRQVPEIDWDYRVDALCRLVLESYRRGDPAILLRDARRTGGETYAIKPLLLADAPTVWFADGGTGKSLLALAAACAMAGHDVFGGMCAARPRRVLYLDWEWDDWQHAERLRQLLGEDVDVADILYRRCNGSMADEVEAIRQTVADEEVTYIVVDSLGAACGGDLTDADTALKFGGYIRSLGVGSLWITHVTKNGDRDADKPFGTVYFHNMARLVWRVKRQSEAESDVIDVGFYCTKANATRISKPVGVRVSFTDERISIDSSDLLSVPGLAASLPLRQRITGELRRGPLTAKELADALGAPLASVRVKLSQAHAAGLVLSVEGDRWALAERHLTPAVNTPVNTGDSVNRDINPLLTGGVNTRPPLKGGSGVLIPSGNGSKEHPAWMDEAPMAEPSDGGLPPEVDA